MPTPEEGRHTGRARLGARERICISLWPLHDWYFHAARAKKPTLGARLSEELLREMVEVVGPCSAVVTVVVDIPNSRASRARISRSRRRFPWRTSCPAREHGNNFEEIHPWLTPIIGRAVAQDQQRTGINDCHGKLPCACAHDLRRRGDFEVFGRAIEKTARREIHRPEESAGERQIDGVLRRNQVAAQLVVFIAEHAFLRDEVRIGMNWMVRFNFINVKSYGRTSRKNTVPFVPFNGNVI